MDRQYITELQHFNRYTELRLARKPLQFSASIPLLQSHEPRPRFRIYNPSSSLQFRACIVSAQRAATQCFLHGYWPEGEQPRPKNTSAFRFRTSLTDDRSTSPSFPPLIQCTGAPEGAPRFRYMGGGRKGEMDSVCSIKIIAHTVRTPESRTPGTAACVPDIPWPQAVPTSSPRETKV